MATRHRLLDAGLWVKSRVKPGHRRNRRTCGQLHNSHVPCRRGWPGQPPGQAPTAVPQVRNGFWLSCQWFTVKSPADLEISVANEGRFPASGRTSSGSPILKRSRRVQHRALSVPQHDCRGWATQAIAVPDSTPDKPRDPDSQKSIRTCGTAVGSSARGQGLPAMTKCATRLCQNENCCSNATSVDNRNPAHPIMTGEG
jgi:hypothetical protein